MPFPMFAAALVAGRTLRYGLIVLLLRASEGYLHRLRQQVLGR